MLSNTRIADLVATQLRKDFGVDIQATELTDIYQSGTLNGETHFSLPAGDDFGIFRTVIRAAHIRVRAAEVDDPDSPGTTWVMVSLGYEHHGGGRNGYTIATYWFDKDGNLTGSRMPVN